MIRVKEPEAGCPYTLKEQARIFINIFTKVAGSLNLTRAKPKD
jgi:hypothetical protein